MPDAVTFALNGSSHTITRAQVDGAIAELPEGNGDVQVWAVETNDGRRLPLKALFRSASGISDFTSQRAQSVLSRLGYRVINVSKRGGGPSGRQPEPPAPNGTVVGDPQPGDRLAILRTAVEYASTRPSMTPTDVTEAATVFEGWMDRA